jgi:hypothetical protein
MLLLAQALIGLVVASAISFGMSITRLTIGARREARARASGAIGRHVAAEAANIQRRAALAIPRELAATRRTDAELMRIAGA